MSAPTPPRRGSGWLMMLLGWALAFFMLTWLYHTVNKAQVRQPREVLSVMSMQNRALVLQENADGQYIAEGFINRVPVTLLVDTGAGQVALSEGLADRLNLRKKYPGEVITAGGKSDAWATDIDMLQIGGIRFRHLRGVILPDMHGDVVLLGMNALGKLSIAQNDGRLILSAPDGTPVSVPEAQPEPR